MKIKNTPSAYPEFSISIDSSTLDTVYPWGHTVSMHKRSLPLLHRLRRIEGQLRSLTASIENDSDCTSVIMQFRATKAAFESAYASYLANNLKQCLSKKNPAVLKAILQEITRS